MKEACRTHGGECPAADDAPTLPMAGAQFKQNQYEIVKQTMRPKNRDSNSVDACGRCLGQVAYYPHTPHGTREEGDEPLITPRRSGRRSESAAGRQTPSAPASLFCALAAAVTVLGRREECCAALANDAKARHRLHLDP